MVGNSDSNLSMSRVDVGQIRFDLQPCDLRAVLSEVCRRQQAIAPQHRFVLDLEGMPRSVPGDPRLLDQVATNIVTNAVKYSPDGGKIAVRGWRGDGLVVCAVGAHATGTPADDPIA